MSEPQQPTSPPPPQRGFPNLALALCGVVLILLASAGERLLESIARWIFTNLTEPKPLPGWEDRWQTFLTVFWGTGVFILCVMMFAGMVMPPFALYRAVRDFFLRRRLRRGSSSSPPSSP